MQRNNIIFGSDTNEHEFCIFSRNIVVVVYAYPLPTTARYRAIRQQVQNRLASKLTNANTLVLLQSIGKILPPRQENILWLETIGRTAVDIRAMWENYRLVTRLRHESDMKETESSRAVPSYTACSSIWGEVG